MVKNIDEDDVNSNYHKNDLKIYKKNLKFIEKFEGIDNISNLYQKVEYTKNEEINNSDSEESCLSSVPVIKLKEKVFEKFEVSDTIDDGEAIQGLITGALYLSKKAIQIKSNISSVIKSAVETFQQPEIKEIVKKQADAYSGIVVDSISRTLADPSHQHKVDEYIVKPIWDLYVIPYIDMYVIFLIMYYVIFMLTMVWIRKNT